MIISIFKKILLISIVTLALTSCSLKKNNVKLKSPNGAYEFSFVADSQCLYSLNWNNTAVIDTSRLGFLLEDGSDIPGNVTIEKVETASHDTTWQPLFGEQSVYRDHYNEALIHFKRKSLKGKYALRVRLYNEGLAFRYEFSRAPELRIKNELTSFHFPDDPFIWVNKTAQGFIMKRKLSKLDFVAARPLLAQISDSLFTSIGEAALVNFARMRLALQPNTKHTLVADLAKDNNNPVIAEAGDFVSPWRFVMVGKTPSELLQNNFLLLNLNKKNQLKNTSYIQPGKVIREVTLTTKGGIACVNFAKKHHITFVEYDAGWYGNEYDDSSDATTITVDHRRSPGPLDLHYVIKYAKENGIGIILYVNRRALEKQLDELLPLYKSWGVAGVKYGFVNVGSQKWTKWLHEAVRKAADYDLMVDIHDEYRPTGYSRTYPNLITQEGIRGDETGAKNSMVINTIFTRMIAGAGDQTNCYFSSKVEKMGSHASQMAKAICIYSPWQFIYWYDRPARSPVEKGGAGGASSWIPEIKDLKFYDELPTVWDSTMVIEGYPGKYLAIARKSNKKWFLGTIAGTDQYVLNLKLDFLDSGKKYKATIYADDGALKTRTNVSVTEIEVTSESVLKKDILPQNGMAVIFTPTDIK